MIGTTLNPAESAMANSAPTGNQHPVSAALVNGLKTLGGVGDVPNALLGALGAANPLAAIAGGVADAIAAPMPSLTATVRADPSVKYGDNFIQHTVGANKTGGINVASGNAENRLSGGGFPTWLIWLLVGVAVVGGFWVWRKG